MRDHLLAAARHRARFVLARRAVPPVARVLIAGRAPVIVGAGVRNTVALHLRSDITVNRPLRLVTGAPAAPPAPLPALPSAVVTPPGAIHRSAALRTPDTPVALHRLERVLTRAEQVATRVEERIPQVTRTVTQAVVPGVAPGRLNPTPDSPRPADPAPARVVAAAPPAPLDLAGITNHVLTAMDDRLSAYAERLGRG